MHTAAAKAMDAAPGCACDVVKPLRAHNGTIIRHLRLVPSGQLSFVPAESNAALIISPESISRTCARRALSSEPLIRLMEKPPRRRPTRQKLKNPRRRSELSMTRVCRNSPRRPGDDAGGQDVRLIADNDWQWIRQLLSFFDASEWNALADIGGATPLVPTSVKKNNN